MSKKPPLFSIVIPTRNRAHLLPYALKSALYQDFDDYEIVVVANDCKDRTRDVVKSMANEKVRYIETDKTLSMPENWEFAWSHARGEYVTYLCDDDAITPGALKLLAEKTLHGSPEVVSWEDAIYYYPEWGDQSLQNTLLLFHFGDELIENLPAKHYQNQLIQYNFAWSSPLPKLLNCIARRDFFEYWRHRMGRLFYPIAPDYSFAWITTHTCTNIRVLHRPLSLRGISENSCGSNAGLSSAGQTFMKEFGDFDFFKETQLETPLTYNLLANTFLRINHQLSAIGITPTQFDREKFIIALANQLYECQSLIPDWQNHKYKLLNYAKQFSHNLYIQVLVQLSKTPVAQPSETLRDMHKRTAQMATEYSKNLEKATDEHHGDEVCGTCVLALRQEIFVDPNWQHLYLFGERIGASDPYEISKKVDVYYDMMLDCRKKNFRYKQPRQSTR